MNIIFQTKVLFIIKGSIKIYNDNPPSPSLAPSGFVSLEGWLRHITGQSVAIGGAMMRNLQNIRNGV